ncbi:MAG: hypothetical protein K2P93_03155 [Alphaproteobacteria bacterium]|nr:hypothetical protein [Alphaproteobacteria bacterium]
MKIKLKESFSTNLVSCVVFLSVLFSSAYVGANIIDPLEKKGGVVQESPPNIGNFALTSSQQPGPLISFGQRVINKDQKQFYLFGDYLRGHKQRAVDLVPSFVYGIRDDLSVQLNLPIAASYKQDKKSSSGLEDAFIQFEHAFYTGKTLHYLDQATMVGSLSFPTGSAKKRPPLGFGSPSFFLGTTFNRTYTEWFGYTSYGIVFTTSNDGIKPGNQFLYQGGIGRNILTIDHEWIIALMVEVDGQYNENNKIKSIPNPNSGGNTVFITPSLWISSEHLIFQLGFGLPATQHLYGHQSKKDYSLAANFGWTF